MKDFLLLFTVSFLLFVNLTLAGDRELNEEEANKALELWRKHCLDQNSDSQEYSFHASDSGYGGYGPSGESKAQIHCKFGPDYVDDSKVVVKPTYATPPQPIKQIIFITPPVHNVRHEITLQGAPTPPRKTLIYVFPAKNTHQFQYQDNRVSTQKLKPEVYFLKNNQLEKQNGGYGRPTYESAASTNLPVPQIEQIAPQQQPSYESVASTLPVQQIQQITLQQQPVVVEPNRIVSPSVPSHYQRKKETSRPLYNYIDIPIEKSFTKNEKPNFTIVPATFAGYYYSGPNENNVSNPTPL